SRFFLRLWHHCGSEKLRRMGPNKSLSFLRPLYQGMCYDGVACIAHHLPSMLRMFVCVVWWCVLLLLLFTTLKCRSCLYVFVRVVVFLGGLTPPRGYVPEKIEKLAFLP
ncbi:unnamed protein product, partial [Pylaiella littoralis]